MRGEAMVDVRIVRKGVAGASDVGVALDDWRRVITADPDLEAVESVVGRNPKTGNPVTIFLGGGGVRLKAHPQERFLLWWEHGEVRGYSIDRAMLGKARELAALLGSDCVVSSE